jgi:hypothetical protein
MARIDEYRFGHITVDGNEHTRDLIILPGRIRSEWWRKDGHGLAMEDFDDVLEELPGHLIVGSGAYGQMKPDPATIEALENRGVKVEVLKTGDAVQRYGELEPAQAAAALHLTC